MGEKPFTIDCNIPAGNIIVDGVEGDLVKIHQDLRTSDNWFYWGFRVAGAEGRTLHFEFTDKYADGPVSVRGPAVTRDKGETWSYAAESSAKTDGFTYTFAADEAETWFYQTFQYLPPQWDAFLARHEADRGRLFTTAELCRSRKGRPVPCARFGQINAKPRYRMWLSSRHHCGEAPATYVLEGALGQIFADDDLGAWLRENIEVMVVPFVDYDGVVDGDQGKGRKPHDHNRDYYLWVHPETKAVADWIRDYAGNDIDVFLDIHDPWVRNQYNEILFMTYGANERENAAKRKWSKILERVQCGSMAYREADNYPWNFGWNTAGNGSVKTGAATGTNVKSWAAKALKSPMIVFGYEVPFASANGKPVTPQSCRDLGRDTMKVLREFVTDAASAN